METIRIVTFGFSIVSFITTLVCILVHYIVPKIRKNPGNFVLIQAYIQLFVDANWVMINGFSDIYYSILPCEALGGLLSITVMISFFYTATVTIEVYLQLNSQAISSHSKRTKVYYVLSIFLAILIIGFSVITKSYGQNFLGFCFYKTSSIGTALFFIYYIAYLFLMLFTSFKSIKKNNSFHSKMINQYLTMVIATSVIESIHVIAMVYLLTVENDEYIIQVCMILAISVGEVLAVFRLWNKELIRDLWWKIFPSKMEFINNDRNDTLLSLDIEGINGEFVSIAEFFEKSKLVVIPNQNLLKLLCALTLRFTESSSEYVINYKNFEFFFTEKNFVNIVGNLQIKNFKKCKQ